MSPERRRAGRVFFAVLANPALLFNPYFSPRGWAAESAKQGFSVTIEVIVARKDKFAEQDRKDAIAKLGAQQLPQLAAMNETLAVQFDRYVQAVAQDNTVEREASVAFAHKILTSMGYSVREIKDTMNKIDPIWSANHFKQGDEMYRAIMSKEQLILQVEGEAERPLSINEIKQLSATFKVQAKKLRALGANLAALAQK
jgi:hypothetical protein